MRNNSYKIDIVLQLKIKSFGFVLFVQILILLCLSLQLIQLIRVETIITFETEESAMHLMRSSWKH